MVISKVSLLCIQAVKGVEKLQKNEVFKVLWDTLYVIVMVLLLCMQVVVLLVVGKVTFVYFICYTEAQPQRQAQSNQSNPNLGLLSLLLHSQFCFFCFCVCVYLVFLIDPLQT